MKWGDREIYSEGKNKTKTQRKDLNEMEVSNMLNKEFKVIIIQMLTGLQRRVD